MSTRLGATTTVAVPVTAAAAIATRDVDVQPAALAQAWLGPGRGHEMIAVPGVTLAAGEVLVRIELATVCGSDVHTVAGRRTAPAPVVLGHEYVGRIAAIGPRDVHAADGRALELGERVVWSIMAHCGDCDRCRGGIPQKCRELRKYGHERLVPRWELTGGFATHMHLRRGTTIVRVGETLPAAVLAPLSCGTATAAAALSRVEDVVELAGATVLVTGAGLVGLTVAAMAAHAGARVIVSDPSPERRRRARRFGAAVVVDPVAGADALATAAAGAGILAVVEASGARSAVRDALEVVDVGGVVVLVGSVFAVDPVPLDPERIVRGLVTVTGVHNYTPDDLSAGVAFIRSAAARAYPFAELVSAPLPLERLDDALALAATGAHVRVGIAPAG